MKDTGFKSFYWPSYFNNDGLQNYLKFQPTYKTITTFSGIISEWESKGLSNEKFTPSFRSNKSISPKLIWMNNFRLRLEFEGRCLNEDKARFTLNYVVNL